LDASSQGVDAPVQVPGPGGFPQSALVVHGCPCSDPPTHFLHAGGVPTTHWSFTHVSAPLQNLPSSQFESTLHCTHAARVSLHIPRQRPPVPQFWSVVQVAPGVGPMKHVLGHVTGVPAPQSPVDKLQLSKPLQ